jgi:transposase InsO family protein
MITTYHDDIGLEKACTMLDVSKKGFMKWNERSYKEEGTELLAVIHKIKSNFPFYGYRRVTHELHRKGYPMNHKKVLKLLQKENLTVVRKKFKPKTTQSNHELKRYPNLAKSFVPTAINQIVVSDITYVHLRKEFVYLAVIMDRYSRRIIGWDLGRDVDTQLTLNALHMAVKLRGRKAMEGCIHHSDHGVQYLSDRYIHQLNKFGMLPSTGEVGNSYDNAHAESLFKTIKYEEVNVKEYESFEEALKNIADFIGKVYNAKRLHSKLGYKPPIEFEKIGSAKKKQRC